MRDDIGVTEKETILSTPPSFNEFEFMRDKELVNAAYISINVDDKAAEEKRIASGKKKDEK